MQRQIIATDQAPAAVGPYSQGVQCGEFVFTAGQIRSTRPAAGWSMAASRTRRARC